MKSCAAHAWASHDITCISHDTHIIVRVGMCLWMQEREYNPYYAFLGQKLCEFKRSHQVRNWPWSCNYHGIYDCINMQAPQSGYFLFTSYCQFLWTCFLWENSPTWSILSARWLSSMPCGIGSRFWTLSLKSTAWTSVGCALTWSLAKHSPLLCFEWVSASWHHAARNRLWLVAWRVFWWCYNLLGCRIYRIG